MSRALIHFGLAKTATSYLQEEVFPKAQGMHYLGRAFLTPRQAILETLRTGRRHKPLDAFRSQERHIKAPGFAERAGAAELQRQLAAALSPNHLNLWSHEGFLRPTRGLAPLDRPAMLGNMQALFHSAGTTELHVLITLRDTASIMKSYARQFYHEVAYLEFENCTLDDILTLRRTGSSDRFTQLMWRLWYSYFDYAALLRDVYSVFPADHVHIQTYEKMRADWGQLEAVVHNIAPEVRLSFPETRINATADKPTSIPLGLQRHLDDLAQFDVTRLYPENARWLQI